MIDDKFAQLEASVNELRALLPQAIANDQQEITMSLAMASSMGLFGAAGVATASVAQVVLQAASAQGNAALGQICAIKDWAGLSRESSSRMKDRGHSWAYLNDEVLELRDLMKEVQNRGINNEWSGEAKERWLAFTDRQIDEHDKFEKAVVKVAPLMFDASEVTDQLLMGLVMAVKGALLPGKPIALRPPMPNPAGLGIGTRTPMLAGLLTQCAAACSAIQNGPWRPRTMSIAASLSAAEGAMKASVARGAL